MSDHMTRAHFTARSSNDKRGPSTKLLAASARGDRVSSRGPQIDLTVSSTIIGCGQATSATTSARLRSFRSIWSSECVVRGQSIFSCSQKDKNLLVCWWCTETKAPKTTQCLRWWATCSGTCALSTVHAFSFPVLRPTDRPGCWRNEKAWLYMIHLVSLLAIATCQCQAHCGRVE